MFQLYKACSLVSVFDLSFLSHINHSMLFECKCVLIKIFCFISMLYRNKDKSISILIKIGGQLICNADQDKHSCYAHPQHRVGALSLKDSNNVLLIVCKCCPGMLL